MFNSKCAPCHITGSSGSVRLNNYTNVKASVSALPGMGSSYLTAAERQALSDWIAQGALNN
jgi:hypothetical protein